MSIFPNSNYKLSKDINMLRSQSQSRTSAGFNSVYFVAKKDADAGRWRIFIFTRRILILSRRINHVWTRQGYANANKPPAARVLPNCY